MGLNTTPRTWTTNELVTAAMMNTEVRDALTGVQAAWTSFTPSWTGSSTNPVIGNGSFSGSAYLQVGKRVDFRIVVTMGSTTTYGTGTWQFSLPVAPLSTARQPFLTDYFDTPSAAYTGSATWASGGSIISCNATPTTAGAANRGVSSTVPHTWAVGDVLTVIGTYEAA